MWQDSIRKKVIAGLEILNHDTDLAPERALNSLELLSFLKYTYRISGDEKYQRAYLKLVNENGYLENAEKLYHANPARETYLDIYMVWYISAAVDV